MLQYIKNKRVLFITTKNPDYIRNTQEIALIEEHAAAYTLVASTHEGYVKRLLSIYRRLFTLRMSDYDTVFLGFAPQLVMPLFAWKFKNVDIVEDFFISMYDTLCCDRCKFQPDSHIGHLLHRIDSRTIAAADAVFVIHMPMPNILYLSFRLIQAGCSLCIFMLIPPSITL